MELTLQAALLALLTISLSGSAAAQASVSVRNSCDSAANSVAIDFTVAFFVEAAGEYFTACSAYGKPENGTFLCILTTRVPPGAAQVLGQTVSAVWSAAASVSGQPGCLRHLQGSKKTGGRYKKVTATGLKDCTAGQPDCLFFEEVKAGREASVPRQLCTTPCASPPSTRWPPPQADSPAGSPVAGPAPPGDALRQLERQALLNFKSGLAKASSLSSWNPDSDPCGGWLGVACDAANTSVVSLTLAGLQLIGVISESLAQLPALFIVDLSRNGLAGPIPYAWQNGTGNAASIRNLRLHDNLFSGPLPPLALPALIAATLHNNLFTGSIPASWARLPASAGISILPQLGPGLCGSLPTYPSLNMAIGNSTKYYNITNSLGSCLEAPCSLPPASLDGSNVFRVAASHKVTAWDVAALNGWTEQPTDASSVEMPCYRSGSPVGGYLGGNQAFQMAAWGDGLLAAGFAAIEPGRKAPCSVIAMRWTVDLRYNLSLAQVVVQAGALGMRGVIVRVGDDPSGVDGTVCADELRAQSFATTAVCLAAGRYLTLVSAQPMHLCSVAAYPAVADAALNQPTFSTRVGRAVVEARNVARDEPFVIQAPPGTSPTYVVDLGQTSLVAAVSIHKAANVQTVSVAASNPLAGNATRRRARSLLQAATTQDCRIDYTSASATPFYCEAAGRYVVVRGTTNTGMELQHPMVFLRMLGAAQPPSMKLLWIGDLLIGGIVAYLPDEGLRQTLLVAYNAAWSRALAEAGHLMNTTASVIISLQKNVTNPAGPPYYYESNFAGSATFTNTTVSVDASLTPDRLREVLGTPAVALDIAKNLSLYGLKRMWMVPYTSEPNSTAVSLNSTNNTENNSGDVGTTSSLGSAAIAGIAVAAAVVAAVGIAGALYVRRRRRRHIEANPAWSRLSSKLLQSASATAGTTDLLLSVLQSKFSNVQLISDSSRRPSGGMAETWRMSANELRVSRPVGRGSYGAVYRGSWQGHVVAIKILVACHVEDIKTTEQAQAALTLPVPTLAKLRAEADMLASLRHPSVVSFYGLIEDPPCIVTEYCARGSLDSVLREGRLKEETARQLTWRRRIQMALEAATGMRYLHSRTPPVVHRDLKGPNLLVTEDWHVKVGDFNLSRAMVEDAPTGSTTTNLNPRWLAPEVMRGQPASLAADVFSFGCCMWELTTWHIPWRNESAWQIVGNVMNGERLAVPPVASLPGGGFSGLDDWLALMHACWAHDPPERPSFEEVTSALRRLLKHTEAPTQGQVE